MMAISYTSLSMYAPETVKRGKAQMLDLQFSRVIGARMDDSISDLLKGNLEISKCLGKIITLWQTIPTGTLEFKAVISELVGH